MLSYISAKEASEKWNISQRLIAILCSENAIAGATKVGNMWMIPVNAEKPDDKRAEKCKTNKAAELKPFIKWVGGKGQLVSEIEKKLFSEKERTFKKYAEPMVGGGALLFSLITDYSFEEIYISDINKELINAFKAVKENVEELITRLKEMQITYLPMDSNGRKVYYYLIRDKFNRIELNESTAVEKASYFIFLNKTCFNGLYRVNAKGQFNVPMGEYRNPTVCDADNLRNINKVLQNVKIVCGDYTLSKDFIDANTFVYIDPPYRPISQTSMFTSYNTQAFDDNEQIRLADYIKELSLTGAKVVLSNSDPKNVNPDDNFFDDLYSGFNIERVSAARMINSKAGNRGRINELLISN